MPAHCGAMRPVQVTDSMLLTRRVVDHLRPRGRDRSGGKYRLGPRDSLNQGPGSGKSRFFRLPWESSASQCRHGSTRPSRCCHLL